MRRKNIAFAGAVLGSALVLTACDFNTAFAENQDTLSYDVMDKVTVLETHTGSGDIVVNESDRSGIRVTETLHWRGDKPTDGHSVNGETLTLKYDCDNCSVDYRVEVPRGLDVKLDTGSGTLTLRSLTGPVKVSTGSGDVDANGLAGKRVTADTGSGDIELTFAGVPDRVEVETGSGDGTVWVPSATYQVTTETGSGHRKVEVDQDVSSPHTVVVKTGSGDAKVLKV
jgi:hypothetical protein